MRAYSTLTEVAPDVTDLQVGQRVMALVPWGAYADSLVVDTVCVLPVTDDMTDLTAAGFPVAYATARVSLVHRGSLRAGQAVVITGATGNVGEDIADYAARDPATLHRALEHCLHWYLAGQLLPRIPTAHPFLDHAASTALTARAAGTAGGKHAHPGPHTACSPEVAGVRVHPHVQ